jgi:YidC/Oxa1 family membrane protein insertase
MKKVQPEMMAIRERFKDDKMKQQQALMELYKKEKINPISGCWPMALQIPVFFALYKVLFVTIEMRHAPFFGWIQDLSAPDPTTLFNLFGLIPWTPPHLLMIGIWPLIMGVTMFVQMRLNPTPADPAQQIVFTWMPVIFTFMLASFPAGLVIYWAWNNTLSVLQQYVIMRRQGVDVDLFGNILDTFRKEKKSRAAAAVAAAAKPALPAAANDTKRTEDAKSAKTKPAKSKRGPKGKPADAKS